MYSVLDGRADTHHACIFFAVTGAMILRQHYKLSALPVAGAAAYFVDCNSSLVATFGNPGRNAHLFSRRISLLGSMRRLRSRLYGSNLP